MDQLEIISPSGDITFYPLSPEKGFTNIGQHPENDIVIHDGQAAPFQAILYHQKKPCQLMLVNGPAGVIRVGGRPLPPQQIVPVEHLSHIEFGG